MAKSLPLLDNILHSGQLAYGAHAKKFEEKLAQYIGIQKLLCSSSFNTAYLIALKTIGLRRGDTVIASPMCCLASSQPLALSGLNVIWADIDPETGLLDPDSVKKSLKPGVKAIIHNHFCGYAGRISEIQKLAFENNLKLIDDVSEAFGTEFQGRKAGNWDADVTIYSFQTVRLPNAIDMGGISFKEPDNFIVAARLRDYGIDRQRFRDEDGEICSGCDITEAAYGALPNDVNAYVGLCSLEKTPELIEQQRENAKFWEKYSIPDLTPLKLNEGSKPNYWVYGGLIENKKEFIRFMKNNGQYAVSGIHLPNYYYSLFGNQKTLNGVKKFYNQFVGIPCGWWMKNGALISE